MKRSRALLGEQRQKDMIGKITSQYNGNTRSQKGTILLNRKRRSCQHANMGSLSLSEVIVFQINALKKKKKDTTKSLRVEKGKSINTSGTLGGKSRSQQSRKFMITNAMNI